MYRAYDRSETLIALTIVVIKSKYLDYVSLLNYKRSTTSLKEAPPTTPRYRGALP